MPRETPSEKQERATQLIVAHKYRWCRARLLHALAGAHEQGVLVKVLEEVLPDEMVEATASEITRYLQSEGWTQVEPTS